MAEKVGEKCDRCGDYKDANYAVRRSMLTRYNNQWLCPDCLEEAQSESEDTNLSLSLNNE